MREFHFERELFLWKTEPAEMTKVLNERALSQILRWTYTHPLNTTLK